MASIGRVQCAGVFKTKAAGAASWVDCCLTSRVPAPCRREGGIVLSTALKNVPSPLYSTVIVWDLCDCFELRKCDDRMRPLSEEETTAVFEKLYKFVGSNLKHIIERQAPEGPDSKPGRYCFRLHKNRVFYVSESLVKRATNVAKDRLVGLGTCIGKFTKTGKFHLTMTCLDLLAAHAKSKIWLKPSAEMSFLYGNHVMKSGLGRITDNTTQNQGVVIFSLSDVPLGFGVAAKSTQDCRKLDPNAIVAYHQADVGEYLRMEDDL